MPSRLLEASRAHRALGPMGWNFDSSNRAAELQFNQSIHLDGILDRDSTRRDAGKSQDHQTDRLFGGDPARGHVEEDLLSDLPHGPGLRNVRVRFVDLDSG